MRRLREHEQLETGTSQPGLWLGLRPSVDIEISPCRGLNRSLPNAFDLRRELAIWL